jgi:hypothetical protein
MGKLEIEGYLNYRAKERKVSASTQNQALDAIVLLNKAVLSPLDHVQEARKLRESNPGSHGVVDEPLRGDEGIRSGTQIRDHSN